MRQGVRGVKGVSQSKIMSLPNRLSTKDEQSILTYSQSKPIKCNPSPCHKTKQAHHQTKKPTNKQKRTKNKPKNVETQLKAILPGLLVRLGSVQMHGLFYLWGWEHILIRFFFQQKQSRKASLFNLSMGSQVMMYG